MDSEDLESCFNIYRTSEKWPSFFTFAKQVAQSALGGDPNKLVWVGLTTVPMGCSWSVDVAQALLRRLVFDRADVSPDSELNRNKLIPEGPISICHLDGFDYVQRARTAMTGTAKLEPSAQTERFRQVCADLGLPMNNAKRA